MTMVIVRGTNEQRAIFTMCWNNFDVHPPIDSHFEVFNITIGDSCYISERVEEFYDEERRLKYSLNLHLLPTVINDNIWNKIIAIHRFFVDWRIGVDNKSKYFLKSWYSIGAVFRYRFVQLMHSFCLV